MSDWMQILSGSTVGVVSAIVIYKRGKRAGFLLGRKEPDIVYKDKIIIKEIPTTPLVCQCGHGICFHDITCHASGCRCQRFVEV